MSVTSASAADLGGNCCADLEERIAELEATTARKGNRKVSLTVSGWVGQQVTFWDDGVESNTYVHDLGSTLGSHVKFTGSAQISPGWSAGYVLQIEAIGSDSLTMNQVNPDGPAALVGTANGVQTLQSYWFIKSDQLGKVSVGKQSQASDNAAILVDGSGSLVPANWVAFDVNSFAVRGTGSVAMTWGNTQSCFGQGGAWGDCNGLTQNVVRYDSPTFGGFSVSASWGEDDMWDVAGRYAGEWGGFKLAAAVAYNEVTDQRYNGGVAVPDQQYFQAGAFLMHVPTGLFGLVNYGDLQTDALVTGDPTLDIGAGDAQTWYGKIGLRSRFSSLGHTVFYGEYLNGQGGAVGVDDVLANNDPADDTTFDDDRRVVMGGSELEVWGAGIVQEIDAAAMSVWVKYRHLSASGLVDSEGVAIGSEDFQYVGVGALINF
jgi:predicted porin